jgi:hypothetical protein
MVRLRGRAPRGERLVDYAPHGHWKTIIFGRKEREQIDGGLSQHLEVVGAVAPPPTFERLHGRLAKKKPDQGSQAGAQFSE